MHTTNKKMTDISVNIESDLVNEVSVYSSCVNKSFDQIVEESLKLYMKNEAAKELEKQATETKLSYDEFWDGVEL